MRILHVAPSIARAYGGPTQSLSGYVAASRLSGAEITIAAPIASDGERETLEEHAGRGNVHVFQTIGKSAFVMSPSMIRWVQREAADHDVVHVHGLFNPISTLCSRASINAGKPVVLRPFGTLSRYTFQHRRSLLKRAYFAAVERSNVVNAAALHFTTDTERSEARWHGVPIDDRAHVVPPPWMSDGKSSSGNARLANRVLFIGRINPIKNLEALIDAWPRVIAEIPDAELLLAGDGDRAYLKSLGDRASSLGVSASVRFAGFLTGTEKQNALASATTFVLPSFHENFGIVILEALAAGLPVVISPQVQLREFVEQNSLGIVANTAATEFSSAICGALRNRELRERVAATAPDMVETEFSPALIGEKLRAMYLHAIENHRNRRARV